MIDDVLELSKSIKFITQIITEGNNKGGITSDKYKLISSELNQSQALYRKIIADPEIKSNKRLYRKVLNMGKSIMRIQKSVMKAVRHNSFK